MKYVFSFLLCAVVAGTALAQTRIQARDIVNQINNGRPVEYNNAIIEGDLDLTDLKNRGPERAVVSFFSFDDDLYEAVVDVPVKFSNCTFTGDVLAYYHIEREDKTYIAHFDKGAAFTNCTFKKASEFKYSKFKSSASFAGSTFNEVANFKYAKFSNGPQFSNVKFESDADFKYAKFPGETSFEKATFHHLANFKYAKFQAPLNMKSTSFEGSEDFKYTKIDGRSFTSHLLSLNKEGRVIY